MHRIAALFAVTLSAAAVAQEVRAGLVANAPTVLVLTVPSGTHSATRPAGAMPAAGWLTTTAPEAWAGYLAWDTAPTGRRWRFENSMYATYPIPSVALLDFTLWLSQAPTSGHLRIELFSTGDFPGTPTVDVFDDGVVDARLPGFGSAWDQHVDVHVPLQLTWTPTPIRVRLEASVPAPLGMFAEVTWEPRPVFATDLGSACTPNLLYPGYSLEDYFLAALPGTAGHAVDFVADGRGALATFVVATEPARLPVGTLGLGAGCDDLLRAPLLDTGGIALGNGRWLLQVPPLPAGLTFCVQHVSLGTGYLGATNVVRYDT